MKSNEAIARHVNMVTARTLSRKRKQERQISDFLYGLAMLIAFLGLGYWGIVTITGGW